MSLKPLFRTALDSFVLQACCRRNLWFRLQQRQRPSGRL